MSHTLGSRPILCPPIPKVPALYLHSKVHAPVPSTLLGLPTYPVCVPSTNTATVSTSHWKVASSKTPSTPSPISSPVYLCLPLPPVPRPRRFHPSFLFLCILLVFQFPPSLSPPEARQQPPVTCHQLPTTRDLRHNCLDAHAVVAGILFNLTFCASRF